MRILWSAVIVTLLVLLVATGPVWCQPEESSDDYLIHPMDVLEVSIYGEEDLVRKLVVRPDGKISFPLIGDIQVAGRSSKQTKEIIDTEISAFIPQASSTVIVQELGSLMFFVLGQVAKPGVFNVSSPLTVVQALSLAGGLTTFADPDSILIIRGHGKQTRKIPFDYSEIRKGKRLEQNILLERGDVVLIP